MLDSFKFLERLPIAIGVSNLEGEILFVNRKYTKIFGYVLSDFESVEHCWRTICPDDVYREKVMGEFQHNFQYYCVERQEDTPVKSYYVTCKDNTVKEIEMSFSLVGNNLLTVGNDVTKKNELIRDLKSEKEFNDNLIENIPAAFFMCRGSDLKMVRCNKRNEEMLGYSAEELNNIHISAFQDETNREEKNEAYQKLQKEGHVMFETTMLRKDGTRIPVYYKAFMCDFRGEQYLIGIGINISDRVTVEKKLRERKQFIEKVLNTSPALIYIFNLEEKRFEYLSGAGLGYYGYTKKEILCQGEKLIYEVIHPDDMEKLSKSREVIRNFKGGEILETEYRVKDKRGQWQFINDRNTVFQRNSNEEVTHVIGSLLEITGQKNTEVMLEREKALNDKIMEIVPGVFYLCEAVNDKMIFLKWNKNLEAITGFTSKEFENLDFFDLFFIEQKKQGKSFFSKLVTGNEFNFEAGLKKKNGKVVPFFFSGVRFAEGNRIFLLGIGIDISKRKKAMDALKESEEKFRKIYNGTSDAILIFDYEYNILATNKTFQSLMETDSEKELRKVKLTDYIIGENVLELLKKRIENLKKNEIPHQQYLVKSRKGRVFPVEARSSLINYNGRLAVLTSFNDISERKDVEKEVFLAAVNAEEGERERIAKDLHDGLGPLLSTCRIYLFNIKNTPKGEKDEESIRNLGILINDALEGIKEISNNVSPHILRNFGLFQAVRSFIDRIKTKTNIEYNYESGRRYSEILELTIYRVITELINNSLKYARASNIRISFKEKETELEGCYDEDGVGFDFERTFKNNKGLGLINIQSRIHSLGGEINYRSEVGKGVEVSFKVPVN